MKVLLKIVFAVSFMFAINANANVVLTLDPANQDSTIGSVVSVNVMIDGLGNFNPVTLAAFDLNIGFDTSALSFVGYNMFDGLGVASTDPLDYVFGLSEALDTSAGEVAPGVIHIGELSFLEFFQLNPIQPGSFALAELLFTVNAEVTSAISFLGGNLVNSSGTADVIADIEINNATVTGVPAPAALTLLGLGILTMLVRQKRYAPSIKSLN
ncbi:cohesin domain-containing protein [uncultured Paraglaciecola sp.]|uniref:cohesin domain-containing protein n=1 Tax=uncultured Paraglaciecola sp. TaxID=1765024 RepID=UPI0030DAA2F2|tara:strand:- start:68611 stop:69246 length:636 start_codon:yes stop_codon:yes gene_type:complete